MKESKEVCMGELREEKERVKFLVGDYYCQESKLINKWIILSSICQAPNCTCSCVLGVWDEQKTQKEVYNARVLLISTHRSCFLSVSKHLIRMFTYETVK